MTRDESRRGESPANGGADRDHLERLVGRLDHEDPDVRGRAVWKIAELAAADPQAVERYVDDVVACVSDPDVWVRRGATWAAEEVAAGRSSASKSLVEGLLDALHDDDALVRENAVVGVASVAPEYPRLVARHLDELRAMANGADETRRGRYATEALEGVRDGLRDDGHDGASVSVRSAAADPDPSPSANVLESDADDGGNRDRDDDAETGADAADDEREGTASDTRGPDVTRSEPPETIPDPVDVTVSLPDIDTDERIRSGPLFDVYRGRADATRSETPVALYRFEALPSEAEDQSRIVDDVRGAMDGWHRIDDHETVVTTLGHGDGPPWLVTELADDGSFEACAAGSGFEEALYYARCLVRAVAYAHSRDVIHGGLSPRSVGVVTPIADAWPVPKVGDWGFARIAIDHRHSLPIHPVYAAPEQIAPRALGRPGRATDVYGLGALLYTLFAGQPPFGSDAKTLVNRVRALERDDGGSLSDELPDPVPPSEYDEAVPDAADALVARALAPERLSRYETVIDLKRDLDRLIDAHAAWD
ncbi:MAG: HEAT repeat domain-containing protein [Haloplanus sp.]